MGHALAHHRTLPAIRPVRPADAAAWCRLRCDLWPQGSPAEHAQEIAAFLAGQALEPLAVLLAEAATGEMLGFVELSIRSCAEGCVTDHVGYLEGWYVIPEARGMGVGRALVQAAESWGRAQACSEFASDAGIDDDASAAAHRALGFAEVGRVRCFLKTL